MLTVYLQEHIEEHAEEYAEMELHDVKSAFDAWVMTQKDFEMTTNEVDWWPSRKKDGKVKPGPVKGFGGEVTIGVVYAF